MTNQFSFLLILNSLFIIFLILNQNDTSKSLSNSVSGSSSNPIQNITWVSLFFEFVLLLIQIKITNL
jgi:preprotein translocase subunit SecG